MSDQPGRTNLAEHQVETGSACAVHVYLPPYRLPYAYRESVQKELQEMQQHGIIEPSTSERASPVVLVKKKTAFATPFGLFQFNVMPFGLQGAPGTFQRMMDRVTHGMEEEFVAHTLTTCRTWEEHLSHICQILQHLRSAGLTVKARKCQFGMEQCLYLGHLVGSGTVRPESSKVEAISAFTTPRTKWDVRTFLGLAGYYRKFIPDLPLLLHL